jgi:hypothetical protein
VSVHRTGPMNGYHQGTSTEVMMNSLSNHPKYLYVINEITGTNHGFLKWSYYNHTFSCGKLTNKTAVVSTKKSHSESRGEAMEAVCSDSTDGYRVFTSCTTPTH